MTRHVGPNFRQATAGWIVGVAALGTILALIGFGPIRGWQQSATLLAQRRADERAERLTLALARDMRGAQETILTQTTPGDSVGWASDFTDLVAGAFARYPYAESFFVSGETVNPDGVSFFNRTGRPPAWMHDQGTSFPFPVVVVTNPTVSDQLLERIRLDTINGRRFSVFDVSIGETPYQIVARLTSFGFPPPRDLRARHGITAPSWMSMHPASTPSTAHLFRGGPLGNDARASDLSQVVANSVSEGWSVRSNGRIQTRALMSAASV